MTPSAVTNVESSQCATSCDCLFSLPFDCLFFVPIANPRHVILPCYLLFFSSDAHQCFEHVLTQALLTHRVLQSLTRKQRLSTSEGECGKSEAGCEIFGDERGGHSQRVASDETNTDSQKNGQTTVQLYRENLHGKDTLPRWRRLKAIGRLRGAILTLLLTGPSPRILTTRHLGELEKHVRREHSRTLSGRNVCTLDEVSYLSSKFCTVSSTSALRQCTPWMTKRRRQLGAAQRAYARWQLHTAETELDTLSDL